MVNDNLEESYRGKHDDGVIAGEGNGTKKRRWEKSQHIFMLIRMFW